MRIPIAATLILCLAGTTFAGGFSGNLDAVEATLDQEAQDLVADTTKPGKRLRKKIDRALTKYRKPATAASYIKELAKAKALVVIADKFLGQDVGLMAEVDDAIATITADLRANRDALETGSQDPLLAKRKAKQLAGKLKRADKAFPLLAPASRAKKMSLLKRIAQLTKGFEGISRNPGAGAEQVWVVSSLTLADAADSVDLNGDGQPDNAMKALNDILVGLDPDSSFDAVLANALQDSPSMLLLQMWGIASFDDDANVAFGVLSGTDTDGDTADNFSGTESFDVPVGLDQDGHAIAHTNTALTTGGAFQLTMAVPVLDLGDIGLENLPALHVRGAASAAANDGVIAFALPVDELIGLFELITGQTITGLQRVLLNNLLDVDLDRDGTNDALSVALDYTAVPAGINAP